MENKKGKVALNDDLLDKVSGGERTIGRFTGFCTDCGAALVKQGESGMITFWYCSNCDTTIGIYG